MDLKKKIAYARQDKWTYNSINKNIIYPEEVPSNDERHDIIILYLHIYLSFTYSLLIWNLDFVDYILSLKLAKANLRNNITKFSG